MRVNVVPLLIVLTIGAAVLGFTIIDHERSVAAAIGFLGTVAASFAPQLFVRSARRLRPEPPGPNDCTAQHPTGACCILMYGHERRGRNFPFHYNPQLGTWSDAECGRPTKDNQ